MTINDEKIQVEENIEKSQQNLEQERNQKKKTYLIVSGVVLLVLLALVIGLLLGKNKKEIVVTGVQPLKEEQKTEQLKSEKKLPSKQPEEIVKDYLNLINQGDYDGAAKYISSEASNLDDHWKNPAKFIFDEYKKAAGKLQFIVEKAIDAKYSGEKLINASLTADGLGTPFNEENQYILVIENGEWRINPTNLYNHKLGTEAVFENTDIKISDLEILDGVNGINIAFNVNSKKKLFLRSGNQGSLFLAIKAVLQTDEGTYLSDETIFKDSVYSLIDLDRGFYSKINFPNAKGNPISIKMDQLYYYSIKAKNNINTDESTIIDPINITLK